MLFSLPTLCEVAEHPPPRRFPPGGFQFGEGWGQARWALPSLFLPWVPAQPHAALVML